MSLINKKDYLTRINNPSVLLFFIFTLAWVWTIWMVPVLVTNFLLPYSALLFPAEIYLIIGALAPSVIALLVIKFIASVLEYLLK